MKATFDYSTALVPSHAKLIASGLPTTVSMRAYVFQDRTSFPVALTIKTCRIVYDVWDEYYRLSISQSGAASMEARAPNLEGVLRRCGRVTDFGLVDRGMLQPGVSYYVAVVVDVDPTTMWQHRLDRWIANPTGPMIPFDATTNGISRMTFRTASFLP
ncbi:MAG: hypothetical protein HY898_23005 [Deltaproteobacteria bacterium]|nr:hypothetical protein [Deltaproteobacteria bacterium]